MTIELNDIMDFKEAGQRLNRIIDEWNGTNWEDTDFIDCKADISNKDVLALIISVTELRNIVSLSITKMKTMRTETKKLLNRTGI